MMEPENMVCETCKFWKREDKTCHRKSPITMKKGAFQEPTAVWPFSDPQDFCGEWELVV